jgi:hypothetical protein
MKQWQSLTLYAIVQEEAENRSKKQVFGHLYGHLKMALGSPFFRGFWPWRDF